MEIEPSARRHGVPDEDMLHALRHPIRAFATDDDQVTMFVGLDPAGRPLEIGVVVDEDGAAIIHAMPARRKFLEG